MSWLAVDKCKSFPVSLSFSRYWVIADRRRSNAILLRLRIGVHAGVLARLDPLLGHGAAVQEAMALVAGFDDVAVMRQSIEQRWLNLPCCIFAQGTGGDHHGHDWEDSAAALPPAEVGTGDC